MYGRLFPLINLLLCLGLTVQCTSSPENKELAYNHFKIGVTLLARGQKEKALEQLLIARDLDPQNAIILNHLGLAYWAHQEYEHAILALQKALEINPTYSESHNNIGRVYIDVKSFSKAREHLFKASQDLTYSHKDKIWLNIGLSYFFEGNYPKSESFFLKSISLNRKNCLGYNYYGRSLIEQEKFKDAAKALDQAIYHCRSKGFDEPHYYSAISFFRLGYKSRAIARLQEGKKRFPNGPNREKIDEMINLMRITETK